MPDYFFTTKSCDRCHSSLDGKSRQMSMFNTDCLCLACIETERQRPDYRQATEADHSEIRKGNFNFKGIESK